MRRIFQKPIETFNVDPEGIYKCPKVVNLHQVEPFRNRHLRDDYSCMNESWENYIKSIAHEYRNGELDYIREFPMPIMNKFGYMEIARKLTNDRSKLNDASKRSMFFLDYFFPKLGIAVELDSSYHFNRKLEDDMRDAYISSEYGIKTMRSLYYGICDKVRDDIFKYKFRSAASEALKYKQEMNYPASAPLVVDFSKYLNDYYRIYELGYYQISQVSEKINQELEKADNSVPVSREWIVANFPSIDVTQNWIDCLKYFYYNQYFKEVSVY